MDAKPPVQGVVAFCMGNFASGMNVPVLLSAAGGASPTWTVDR
ncbi:MAG: hypothetical protein OXG70_07700 [Cyanobacteria bacterium MAG IRC1_bin_28]|nr:hypothetical protein [Cyanobacteria bacterium MAG IRC1_bin_28]MDE0647126.1 hypothetical protein [Cyanobacteria bacterium MAG IRC4_bin_6]